MTKNKIIEFGWWLMKLDDSNYPIENIKEMFEIWKEENGKENQKE